jgi:hypothetical protein
VSAVADELELDAMPAWFVQFRFEWDDRIAAAEELVAAGELMPWRLEQLREQRVWAFAHLEHSGVVAGGRELTQEELYTAADRDPVLRRVLRPRELFLVRPMRRLRRFGRSPRRQARARSCARTPARPEPDRPVGDPRRRAA